MTKTPPNPPVKTSKQTRLGSPAVLRTVTLLRMGYACSSIEISTQREILSQIFKKITKIDAQEPLKLINSPREIIYTCSVVKRCQGYKCCYVHLSTKHV